MEVLAAPSFTHLLILSFQIRLLFRLIRYNTRKKVNLARQEVTKWFWLASWRTPAQSKTRNATSMVIWRRDMMLKVAGKWNIEMRWTDIPWSLPKRASTNQKSGRTETACGPLRCDVHTQANIKAELNLTNNTKLCAKRPFKSGAVKRMTKCRKSSTTWKVTSHPPHPRVEIGHVLPV